MKTKGGKKDSKIKKSDRDTPTKNTDNICPKCGNKKTVPISYGLASAEAGKMEKEGKIWLGGCCIDSDSPKWH